MNLSDDQTQSQAELDDSPRTQKLVASDMPGASPSESAVPDSWVDVQAAGSALLELRRGPGQEGQQFVLDAEITELGRHPECGVVLDHATVSRHHAEIRRAGHTYTVRDLGSLNGTYLNRKAVDSAELGDGDEISIGTFRLAFRRPA